MTPSTKLMIAADRLANRPCSDTERATANLLTLISQRLHERGFYPESELRLALALADAIDSEHGPEASATQPVPPVKREITIQDRGWELAAYDSYGTYLGGARRNCIGGSRGRSWYWSVEVSGAEPSEARRKPEARAELLRIATEVVGARELSADLPLPDRAEADLYLPDLAEVAAQPDATTKAGA